MVKLVIVEGPDRGRDFSVTAHEELQIGRGRQTQTQLTDPSVSRLHCVASISAGRVRLKDCSSGSGLLRNGEAFTEGTLDAGDLITIGDTVLRLEVAGAPDEQTIPPKRQQAMSPVDAMVASLRQQQDASGTGKGAGQIAVPPLMKAPRKAPSRNLGSLKDYVLHKYRIETAHVRGNSGMVFRAKHIESGEQVAVKVMWPDLMTDDSQMKRFVRAMKTMRPIKHPNIVRVLNAGITELAATGENFCWFAMEFVDGFSLAQVVKRVGAAGMLDWEQAFRIAVHVARALEVAHQHSIVHRNITPENILVARAEPIAKLGDLMLARAIEETGSNQITRDGELLGDVAYMSPERTRGEDIDHRSDLYGLGATLYAVLSGQPPFQAASIPTLLNLIQEDEPLPPKTFQLAINESFQNVVMRLLEKNPADRFESPSDLLKELDRIGKFAGIEIA